MFMSITAFQKDVTVSMWMFNNVLLNKRGAILSQLELPWYKYNQLDIFKQVNYGKLWI